MAFHSTLWGLQTQCTYSQEMASGEGVQEEESEERPGTSGCKMGHPTSAWWGGGVSSPSNRLTPRSDSGELQKSSHKHRLGNVCVCSVSIIDCFRRMKR